MSGRSHFKKEDSMLGGGMSYFYCERYVYGIEIGFSNISKNTFPKWVTGFQLWQQCDVLHS